MKHLISIALVLGLSACGSKGSQDSQSSVFQYAGDWQVTNPLTNCAGPNNCVQAAVFPAGCNGVQSSRPAEIIFGNDGTSAKWSNDVDWQPLTKTGDVYQFPYNNGQVIFTIEPYPADPNAILIAYTDTCQFLMFKGGQ